MYTYIGSLQLKLGYVVYSWYEVIPDISKCQNSPYNSTIV